MTYQGLAENKIAYYRDFVLRTRPAMRSQYTHKAIAAFVGVTRSAVSKYERGNTQPRNDVANKLTEYFQKAIPNIRKTDLFFIRLD